MSKAFLVVFEGIDGSGKTTIAKEIVKELEEEGLKALYTYEPYSEEITSILNKLGRGSSAWLETLLMAADRYYHVQEVIEPAINEGMTVVSDRYFYSSVAYQGARGADPDWILTVNRFVRKPDLAIYLDVPPEVGLERKKHSTTRVRYLEEDMDVIRRVRSLYKELVGEGHLIEVDTSQSIDDVLRECRKIMCRELSLLCR